MNATDVMVRNVVTVHPETDMGEAVKLLAEHDVSALPVLDGMGNLVGMLSEADLIHRVEIGTEKHRPWWQEAVTGASTLAADFAKSHGKKVGEIMTTGVVSVSEDTPLSEIAATLERNGVKRVPVLRDGKLVGIVSHPTSSRRSPRWSAASTSTTRPTARSGSSCCRGWSSNRGRISGAATSRSAIVSSIYGGSSAQRRNARRCGCLQKTYPE